MGDGEQRQADRSGFWARDRANGSPVRLSLFFGIPAGACWIAYFRHFSYHLTAEPMAYFVGFLLLSVIGPALVAWRSKSLYLICGVLPACFEFAVIGAFTVLRHLHDHHFARMSSDMAYQFRLHFVGSSAVSTIVSLPRYFLSRTGARRIAADEQRISDRTATEIGAWPPAPVAGPQQGDPDA